MPDYSSLFAEGGNAPAKSKYAALFDPSDAAPAGPETQPERTLKGTAGDVVNTAAQAAVGAGEAVVGLANIATAGGAGKFLEDKIGYRPKETRKILDDNLRSDAQKFADEKVEKADGFVDTVKAAASNPSTIVTAAAESLPSMFLGGGVAKGLGAVTKIGKAGRAAIGEGAISAGASAEGIRQETKDGDLTLGQTTIAVLSGGLTAIIGRVGGAAAKRMGIEDLDQAVLGEGLEQAGKKAMALRVIAGGIQEGVLEELPQSMQEQIASNLALGKKWDEGVGKAGAMGMLSGAALGGALQTRGKAVEPPTATTVVNEVEAATPPDRPSVAPGFAANAFAQVGGHDEQQLGQKGVVALSLAQIAAAEGEQGLVAAIEHLSAGNPELAETLFEASTNPDYIAAGRETLNQDARQFISFNDEVRTATGLDGGAPDGTAAPVDNTQQVDPTTERVAPTPVQMQNLGVQMDAVRDGLLHGAVVSMEQADQIDVNDMAYAVATGPDGRTAIIVAKDDEMVQGAVARAAEVGLDVVAAELATPIQGKAAVRQVGPDGVASDSVQAPGDVSVPKGGGVQIRTVDEALSDRVNQLAQEERQAPADVAPAAPPGNTSSFFKRGSKKSQAQPEFSEIEQTGAARALIDGLNSGNKLEGDEQISHTSLTEVRPKGPLARLVPAISSAFGVNVVFVNAPNGLMRKNGRQFNSFSGVAQRSTKTVFIRVDSNVPLNILGHELAHILESEHPDVYDKLEMVVLSRMRSKAADALHARLSAAVGAESVEAASKLSQEFRAEVVAEAIGEMAEDQSFWDDIFSSLGKDGTAAKSFYQKVLDVIAKLQRALTSSGYITGNKDIADVKRAVTAAYKAWAAEYEANGGDVNNLNQHQLNEAAEARKAEHAAAKAKANEEAKAERKAESEKKAAARAVEREEASKAREKAAAQAKSEKEAAKAEKAASKASEQTTGSVQSTDVSDKAKAALAAAEAKLKERALVALRKRATVLTKLRACLS